MCHREEEHKLLEGASRREYSHPLTHTTLSDTPIDDDANENGGEKENDHAVNPFAPRVCCVVY